MLLLRPTGRFQVGVQDVKWTSVDRADKIAADNHVVGRLFYPCKPRSLLQRLMAPPLTWIRSYDYAAGYVSWGLRNPSTIKQKLLKQAAQNTIYALGTTRLLQASYNAPPEDGGAAGPDGFPLIIFSHGAASMRNTYSILCTEFASRGFVVAAIEHADGTACCVELATGEHRLLTGLGSGAALEAKCDYRVQEVLTMASLLQAMSAGTEVAGVCLSGSQPARSAFKGLLDTGRMAVMGHSCGGATAAAAVAAHAEFKAGIALDPWWPLLPGSSPALNGWQTSSPLLVLGSQDWNQPDTMYCGGERQQRLFQAAMPTPGPQLQQQQQQQQGAAQPRAAAVVAAAAVSSGSGDGNGSSNGGGGVGGGVLHVVPAGSSHGSFTDLPHLLSPWVSQQLRRMAGAKPNTQSPVAPSVIQDAIVWSSHRFLQEHLPLLPGSVASMEQLQQQQEQQGQEAAAAAPAGDIADKQQQQQQQAAWQGPGRAESLADHLAADEVLIAADEAAQRASIDASSSASSGQQAAPVAHSAQHDAALESASSAQLAAAAAARHVPVALGEERRYAAHLGDSAWLVAAHTR